MAGQDRHIHGVVVRLQPYGDADLIVAFVGAEVGRVDAFARSARSSLKRFGGRLELFVEGDATLRIGTGRLPTLASFERTRTHVDVALDYARLALASLIAELACQAAQPDHADARLYAWLVDALPWVIAMDSGHLAEGRLAVELSWLNALGALPVVARCGACGGTLNGGASWPEADDGLRCRDCSPHGAVALDAGDMAAFTALQRGELDAAAPRLSGAGAQLLRRRSAGLLADHLPRAPRSADALDRILAGNPRG